MHIFLDHTVHTKGYVCTECDNIDVVAQRFQRHIFTMHHRKIADVEQFFRPCRPFTKLFECTQKFCVFVAPVCEVMCLHQAKVHGDQMNCRAASHLAVGEAIDGTPKSQLLSEAPLEKLRLATQPSSMVLPELVTKHLNVGLSTASGMSEGGGPIGDVNANADQFLQPSENDNNIRACYRFVENLSPPPRLHSPRYFPLERMVSSINVRGQDFRYLAQLTFGSSESLFLAMYELPPVGDSVMMRSCSSPYVVIARVEVTEHRGFLGTKKSGQHCGSSRPWRCSGPMIDTHSQPWGLIRRVTMSIPPPRGCFMIVNAIARSSQICRVLTLADS